MKAMLMTAKGGPEVLRMADLPAPVLPDGQHVLVRVAAAGVNPLDTKVRRFHYHYPDSLPVVLGCDGAGVVETVGAAVTRWKAGDEVYFMNGGIGGELAGNYATHAVVHEAYLAAKPTTATMVEAAAMPLALITAWEGIVFRGGLEPGQRILVHGGAGGVGHLAIQVARFMRTRIATTVSDDEKADFVRSLGAELVVDYRRQDFNEAIDEWTNGEGVDLVLDTAGGETFVKSLAATRIYGRVVTIVGAALEKKALEIARKRNLLVGYEGMLTPMTMNNHRARLAQTRILEQGARLFDQGKLKPRIARTFPLEQAADAHLLVEQGHTVGKVVLTVA